MGKNTGTVKKVADLGTFLEETSEKWENILNDAKILGQEALAALSDKRSDELLPRYQHQYKKLKNAVHAVQERSRNPVFTLATVGTTSSGKSTIANLLIGDDIMPSAVAEMSAGVVSVEHSHNERKLIIKKTKGATWECGEWDNLCVDEIRERLRNAMQAYDKQQKATVGRKEEPDPIQCFVKFPTLIGNYPERFGLPDHIEIMLLDLPGLKSIDDERNAPVIRDNVKKALAILAYDASENDPTKQRKLLNEIVDQVGNFGSAAIGRMLFVLNKMDKFKLDRGHEEEGRENAISKVSKQICSRLRERFPEDTVQINKIRPIPISALPAFLAMEVRDDECSNAVREDAYSSLIQSFGKLLERDQKKGLSLEFNDVPEERITVLSEDVIHVSGVQKFENSLKDRIQKELPGLLIDDVQSEAQSALNDLLSVVTPSLKAGKYDRQDQVDRQRKLLKSAMKELREKSSATVGKLSGLEKTLRSSTLEDYSLNAAQYSERDDRQGNILQRFFDKIQFAAKQLLKGFGVGKTGEEGELELLSPLYRSYDFIVRQPYENVTDDFGDEVLRDATLKHSNRNDEYVSFYNKGWFAQIPIVYGYNYYNSLVSLRDTPYGEDGVWNKENAVMVRISKNNGNAANVLGRLEEFSRQLTLSCSEIFRVAARKQMKQVRGVLIRLSRLLIQDIQESIKAYLEEDNAFNDFPGILNILDDFKPELPKIEIPSFVFTFDHYSAHEESHLEEDNTTFMKSFLAFFGFPEYREVVDKPEAEMVPTFHELVQFMLYSSNVPKDVSDWLSNYFGNFVHNMSEGMRPRINHYEDTFNDALSSRSEELSKQLKYDHAQLNHALALQDELRRACNLRIEIES